MIAAGNFARLNEAGLRWMLPRKRPSRAREPWEGRICLVKSVSKRAPSVTRVVWNGNVWISDGIPTKFLEVVDKGYKP
jgi:hypothetical protein